MQHLQEVPFLCCLLDFSSFCGFLSRFTRSAKSAATSLPVDHESAWSGHSQKEQKQPLFERFKDEIVSCHSFKSLCVPVLTVYTGAEDRMSEQQMSYPMGNSVYGRKNMQMKNSNTM